MPINSVYSGNGVQTDFTITFDFASRDFVEVYVSDILQTLTTHYSFLSDSQIRFVTAPASGTDNVEIRRNTSSTPLVDWANGASITEAALESSQLQALHLAEEAASEDYVASAVAEALITPSVTVSAFGATLIDDATAAAARATLGSGAMGDTLFQSASGSLALIAMGVAGNMLSVLDDTTMADARSSLGVIQGHYSNILDNGDFGVWQNGTSFTSSGSRNNDVSYVADQWILLSDGNNVVDVSKVTSSVPSGGVHASLRATVVAANTKFAFMQPIESKRVAALNGKTVSFSAKISGPGQVTGIRMLVLKWTGSADAITRDPITAWGISTATPTTYAANWALVAETTATLTGSGFDTVSMTASITGATNLAVLIMSNDAAFAAAEYIDISSCKLEVGTAVTEFQSRSLGVELAACQRYFVKTFPQDTIPAQNTASQTGALHAQMNYQGAGNPRAAVHWQFPVPMLKAPTVTTYSPNAASSSFYGVTGAASLAANVISAGEAGVFIRSNASATAIDTDYYAVHATADARL